MCFLKKKSHLEYLSIFRGLHSEVKHHTTFLEIIYVSHRFAVTLFTVWNIRGVKKAPIFITILTVALRGKKYLFYIYEESYFTLIADFCFFFFVEYFLDFCFFIERFLKVSGVSVTTPFVLLE